MYDKSLTNTNKEYGYSSENPIKVGAFENSRLNKNHRIYLSSLRGPNGNRQSIGV